MSSSLQSLLNYTPASEKRFVADGVKNLEDALLPAQSKNRGNLPPLIQLETWLPLMDELRDFEPINNTQLHKKDVLDSIQYLARPSKKEGSEPVHYSTAEPSMSIF